MNKFISTIFAATIMLCSYSVIAATTPSNTDDASALGTSDTPQVVNQDKTTTNKTNHKPMMHKNRMHHSNMDMKAMDTNGDGMISKDEYMAYNETSYGKMKQTNGMVSTKDMEDEMNAGTTKGNKLQPSEPANAAPAGK